MTPRPYQTEAVERAFAAFARGDRSTIFVCPTGGGKSFVFSLAIARHARDGGGRALVLADRAWLVEQARDNVRLHAGLSCEVEMGRARVDRKILPDVVAASVQSLANRLRDFPQGTFDLLVVDEADLALAPTYRRVIDHFSGARVLGVTATPDRHDGVALREVFESVCLDVDIRDLIDAGYLSRVRQWPVKVLDLSRVRVEGGDLDERSLDEILREERHLHEVVKPTLELAGDRPTLVFGVSVRHAELLAALFCRYRPESATALSGRTPRAEQREAVGRLVRREVQFLCNCNLVMRGVDVPEIACVAMARPTQSRTVYVQGLGRGTRVAPGKEDLLVLDFTDGSDSFSLVSAVDVLGGRASPEARERAREILDDEPGSDVTGAIDRATAEVARDPALRARVLAKVRYRTREIALRDPIDWRALPLGERSDAEIAAAVSTTEATVTCARHRLGIRMGG